MKHHSIWNTTTNFSLTSTHCLLSFTHPSQCVWIGLAGTFDWQVLSSTGERNLHLETTKGTLQGQSPWEAGTCSQDEGWSGFQTPFCQQCPCSHYPFQSSKAGGFMVTRQLKKLHTLTLPCCCTSWLGSAWGNVRDRRRPAICLPTTGLDLVWSAIWRSSLRCVWEVFILSFHPWCELDIGKRIFRGRRKCVRTKFGVACKENSSVASAFLLKEERSGEKHIQVIHVLTLRRGGSAELQTYKVTLDACSMKILVTQLWTDKP